METDAPSFMDQTARAIVCGKLAVFTIVVCKILLDQRLNFFVVKIAVVTVLAVSSLYSIVLALHDDDATYFLFVLGDFLAGSSVFYIAAHA